MVETLRCRLVGPGFSSGLQRVRDERGGDLAGMQSLCGKGTTFAETALRSMFARVSRERGSGF